MPETDTDRTTSLDLTMIGPIVRAEDLGLRQGSDRLLSEAKQEAKRLRDEAREAREAARLRGLAEGQLSGKKEAAKLVAEAKARVDRYLASLEGGIAEVLMEALEGILGRFEPRELVQRAACHALSKARRDRRMTLHVAPAIVAELSERIAREMGAEVLDTLVIVQGDPERGPADCALASDLGVIELGVDAQLAALRSGLRGPRGG